MKDAIDWSLFPPLLKDLYHNDMDNGGRPNVPIVTMIKVLFLQSMFNMVDEQAGTLIRDRISFMNFLDYPDLLPDAKTIWYFRERLSRTGNISAMTPEESTAPWTGLSEGISFQLDQ